MIRALASSLAALWLSGSLILLLGACGPATVGSLHPVTLQPGPREPSRIPEAEPERLTAVTDQGTGDEDPGSAAEGAEDEAADAAAPPKRKVVSGDLREEDKPTLMEIAQRERERRRDAPPPMARIDDRNIERRASAAVRDPDVGERSEPVEQPPETKSADSGDELVDAERYWRQRVLALRYEWQDLVDQERRLEARVNELRRDFYEEDDAYYRDAEIKPEWDQAWSELQQTRRDVLLVIEQLDRTIEDGRRAGALPGWLREGIELEPERAEERERESLGIAEPVEPDEVNRAREIDE